MVLEIRRFLREAELAAMCFSTYRNQSTFLAKKFLATKTDSYLLKFLQRHPVSMFEGSFTYRTQVFSSLLEVGGAGLDAKHSLPQDTQLTGFHPIKIFYTLQFVSSPSLGS